MHKVYVIYVHCTARYLECQGDLLGKTNTGAGMFLGSITGLVETAVGCDLSESMAKRGRRINSALMIQGAEACALPYATNAFDAILIYSVFHYFPSYNYASRALSELLRVCRQNGRIWLGDVPDAPGRSRRLSIEKA